MSVAMPLQPRARADIGDVRAGPDIEGLDDEIRPTIRVESRLLASRIAAR